MNQPSVGLILVPGILQHIFLYIIYESLHMGITAHYRDILRADHMVT